MILQQCLFVLEIPSKLEPRPATTGIILDPRYFSTYKRESQSEPPESPRDQDHNISKQESSLKYNSVPSHIQETVLGPNFSTAKAIESSTDVLVSTVKGQNELSSMLSSNSNIEPLVEEKNSPDFEQIKSPSTEFTTSTVETTPVDENIDNFKNKDSNENDTVCDTMVERESKRYFV